MQACFLFPFQNEYEQNVGTCLRRLFLANFTTLTQCLFTKGNPSVHWKKLFNRNIIVHFLDKCFGHVCFKNTFSDRLLLISKDEARTL